ncbi:MAG TPA: hypothetical protein DEP79_06320 [Gammaproteobacteria bacterium]|nr:hypothetical protein [Gammaproteobacteria bacterium]
MLRFPLLILLLSLLAVAGCSSHPPAFSGSLERRADYAEENFTNARGLDLFARTWEPAQTAKANVILLHGTALHSGLYVDTATYLSQQGYRVYAYDMQSWGRSQGLKGHGYVDSFDAYSNDLKFVLQMLRKRYPGVKNVVMGESLGGAVALYTAVKHEFLLNGVITSAVGYKPSMKLLGIRAPDFINEITLTTTQWVTSGFSSFPAVESDTGIRLVIDNDSLQSRLLDDPLVAHGWLPGAYVSTILAAGDYMEPRLRYITVPILLLHGNSDALVPVTSSQEIFDEVSSVHKRLLVYNSAHAVLLENQWRQAATDIVTFLDQMN